MIALRNTGIGASITMNILKLVDFAWGRAATSRRSNCRHVGHMEPIGRREQLTSLASHQVRIILEVELALRVVEDRSHGALSDTL